MACYVGGIGPHRGLNTAVKALPYIKGKIPNFKLVIVGAKGDQANQILSDAATLNVEDMVEVIGWQPFKKVNSYVMASKVCLVPHNDFEHTHTTVPHKLFQYMICSKPVLVSSCRPLKRIVEDTKAGVVFRANDPGDLAKKFIYMYENSHALNDMGLNGREAALGKYAWRHDAERLIDFYTDLSGKLNK